MRMRYVGCFRQVSTRPSGDTNQSVVDMMELDIPGDTQQAPSHVDEELPVAHQPSTAEESQLNDSEMFSTTWYPPIHGSYQARHNRVIRRSFDSADEYHRSSGRSSSQDRKLLIPPASPIG